MMRGFYFFIFYFYLFLWGRGGGAVVEFWALAWLVAIVGTDIVGICKCFIGF